MKLKVFFDRLNEKKEIEIEENINVKQLLEKLGINPVEVVVVKNGKIVVEGEKLKDGDELKLISVVSGG